MWKSRLSVVISSVLLGAAFAQADPAPQPSQQEAEAPSQTQPSEASSSGGDNVDVGSERSNVDEQSSSGSYYPYSAGTAGDDPADPTSTSVDTSNVVEDKASASIDQWTAADSDGDGYLSLDELKKATPTYAASFDEIDVDRNRKLTRDEFRVWEQSREASMDADTGPDAGFSSARESAGNAGESGTAPESGSSPESGTSKESGASRPDDGGR